MIDWLVIYGILAGLVYRAIHHNRLVVPGMAWRTFFYGLIWTWVRGFVVAFIIITGSRLYGFIPETYRLWWTWYFRDHSLGIWILLPCTLTVALYLLKEITYRVFRDPHGYKFYDEVSQEPTYVRTKMGTPLIWFALYWIWLLLSPWLPFSRCFVQVYLLGRQPCMVFSMSGEGMFPIPRTQRRIAAPGWAPPFLLFDHITKIHEEGR